jgi:hypothetical protein
MGVDKTENLPEWKDVKTNAEELLSRIVIVQLSDPDDP